MYVVKKNKRKIKINKQKGNKQTKKIKKKIKKNFIRQFGSVFNKKMVKSVIYLLFSYQTGYKCDIPGLCCIFPSAAP
jgi:hypothetical protein